MSWTKVLEREIHYTYAAADGLMKLVDADHFDWKPDLPEGAESTGWMTMGQLLQHMTTSCGLLCQAFQKDDWSFMQAEASDEGAAARGARMPEAASVEAAREALAKDRELAIAVVQESGDDRMANESVTAPWGVEGTLGDQYLDMVKHLGQHKGQLFYYLKLLGKPVHTGHLWGME